MSWRAFFRFGVVVLARRGVVVVVVVRLRTGLCIAAFVTFITTLARRGEAAVLAALWLTLAAVDLERAPEWPPFEAATFATAFLISRLSLVGGASPEMMALIAE